MRKRFMLLGLIALILPALASAQLKPGLPGLDLGLKVGANFAQLNGKSWDDGYKANYLAGIFAGLRAKKVGVQVEAFFSQTKYTTTGKEFSDAYPTIAINQIAVGDSAKERSFNVGYLNIPVLFQYNIFSKLWLQVGPQYSGVVTVKDVDGLAKDAKSLFKSGDISGVVGLEAKLPFHLNAGARYVFGLSDMNNTGASGAWQQRTIQVHLGYSFL